MVQERIGGNEARRLTRAYVLSLGLMAVMIIVAGLLLDHMIATQADSGHVINIAGRQRMLSQRISKMVLALGDESLRPAGKATLAELAAALAFWERSHQGLRYGDAGLALPGDNSAAVQGLFETLEPRFQAMHGAVHRLLADLDNLPPERWHSYDFTPTIRQVLENEAPFLATMDSIVFQYDREGRARIARQQWLQIGLSMLELALLAGLGWFVLRPATRHIRTAFSALETSQAALQESQTRLEARVEERTHALHLANEALRSERENLARRVEERTLELRSAYESLQQAMRTKDEFLATVSHELRTPLNAILGLAQVLELEEGLSGEQGGYLADIRENGERLLSLINDMLDMAMCEMGQFELNIAPIRVVELTERSVNLVRTAALAKQQTLTWQVAQPLNAMLGDAKRLKQVLFHLLSNAVKFTPTGGAITLTTDYDQRPGYVRFSVRDTGIGIAAEEQKHLFEPFTQADSGLDRRFGGTGLGLALVDRLTRLHGGYVEVDSAPGRGSCFTIVLPLTGAEA